MKELFVNILLLIITIILCGIFIPIGIVVAVFYSVYNLSVKYFANVVFEFIISLDRMGNVLCGQLFNNIFTKQGRNFGYSGDTVSKVLAINQNNLTQLGRLLSFILEKRDKGHLQNSLIEKRSGL